MNLNQASEKYGLSIILGLLPCFNIKPCEFCPLSINYDLPFGEISVGCEVYMNQKQAIKEAVKRSKSDPEFAAYTNKFLQLLCYPVFLVQWDELRRYGAPSDDQIKALIDKYSYLLEEKK